MEEGDHPVLIDHHRKNRIKSVLSAGRPCPHRTPSAAFCQNLGTLLAHGGPVASREVGTREKGLKSCAESSPSALSIRRRTAPIPTAVDSTLLSEKAVEQDRGVSATAASGSARPVAQRTTSASSKHKLLYGNAETNSRMATTRSRGKPTRQASVSLPSRNVLPSSARIRASAIGGGKQNN